MASLLRVRRRVLLVGDTVIYAVVTVLGFSTHGLLETAPASRYLATFLPFLAAWLLAAAATGALEPAFVESPGELWRPAIAGLLAAPLGGVLRGVWLGSPVLPIFVAIMAAVSILAILVWRSLLLLVLSRRPR